MTSPLYVLSLRYAFDFGFLDWMSSKRFCLVFRGFDYFYNDLTRRWR